MLDLYDSFFSKSDFIRTEGAYTTKNKKLNTMHDIAKGLISAKLS